MCYSLFYSVYVLNIFGKPGVYCASSLYAGLFIRPLFVVNVFLVTRHMHFLGPLEMAIIVIIYIAHAQWCLRSTSCLDRAGSIQFVQELNTQK